MVFEAVVVVGLFVCLVWFVVVVFYVGRERRRRVPASSVSPLLPPCFRLKLRTTETKQKQNKITYMLQLTSENTDNNAMLG